MMPDLDGARRILLSPATTLEGLASEVGLTAEELFFGINFDGVDLTDERVELLERIDADFSGAILTRQQKTRLANAPAQRERTSGRIAKLRAAIMQEFIEENVQEQSRSKAIDALIHPLIDRKDGKIRPYDPTYARRAAEFLHHNGLDLSHAISSAFENLLDAMRRARFPLDHNIIDLWPSTPGVPSALDYPERFGKLVDFDLCTVSFVTSWLDMLEEKVQVSKTKGWNRAFPSFHGNRLRLGSSPPLPNQEDLARQQALLVAMRGPSRPPPTYIEIVLGYARSAEEIRHLAVAIPPGALDQKAVGVVSRMLAQAATDPDAISAVLTDKRLDTRVLNAFRRLLIAAGSTSGRRLLLETIASHGERASGLEVDAIVDSLSFDEALTLLRPYWNRLTPHHKNIARASLLGKAKSPGERAKAENL